MAGPNGPETYVDADDDVSFETNCDPWLGLEADAAHCSIHIEFTVYQHKLLGYFHLPFFFKCQYSPFSEDWENVKFKWYGFNGMTHFTSLANIQGGGRATVSPSMIIL